jgi:hypothetical protein
MAGYTQAGRLCARTHECTALEAARTVDPGYRSASAAAAK